MVRELANSQAPKVVICSAKSSWSIPGVTTGPALLQIFIHDLEDGEDFAVSKFADDTKLEGVANRSKGCAAI